jgi:hypothetical protein
MKISQNLLYAKALFHYEIYLSLKNEIHFILFNILLCYQNQRIDLVRNILVPIKI